MRAQQTFNLNIMQIQQAAAAGVQLLTTPGCVRVDGTMAVTDVVANLQKILNGIATGQLMVTNVAPQQGHSTSKTSSAMYPYYRMTG